MGTTLLFYKERIRAPNKKDTPGCNQGHVFYIGNRSGVVKQKGYDNGLFGHIQNEYHSAFENRLDAESRVYAMSKKGYTVYRSIISFTGAQAEGLGLYTQEDWQKYVKLRMVTIAREHNIDLKDLEYVAAVHEKPNQPHVHIVFWSKNPRQVQVQYVNPKQSLHLRASLIKETYPEMYQKFCDQKNIARSELRMAFTEVMTEYENWLLSQPSGEYLLYRDEEKSKERQKNYMLTDNDLETIHFEVLHTAFQEMREQLPDSGRLAYKLLPPGAKKAVDQFTDTLLDSCEKLRNVVTASVSAQLDLAEMYTSNPDSLKRSEEKFYQQIYAMVGNIVLDAVKDMKSYANANEFQESMADTILRILMYCQKLMKETHTVRRGLSSGELSKEAKRERMKQLHDKGIGVER